MLKQLFATKNVLDITTAAGTQELHRTLGPWALTALGIGAIIGTGIFVLTGIAAANNAGPALALAFVFAGIACALAGLCYAEFASMIPVAGSAYSYSYATLGEFVAWFIGWNLILEYLFAASTVSVGWSGYVTSWLNQHGINFLPDTLTNAPFAKGSGDFDIVRTSAIINLPAVVVVGAITTLCTIGIRQSAMFNSLVVALKVAVVVLVIGFGVLYVNPDNWVPFIPANTGPGQFGWTGIFRAAGIIFFAYIGFDAVSTAAQEAKNPQRDVAFGMLVSLAICTVLYIAMALVLTGMVHYTKLNVPAPVAVAIDAYPALGWLRDVVKLGAIAGMTSVILVMIVGQPRIFMAMARDGLLPPVFGRIHPRFKTPHVSTIITGVLAAAIGGLFPVQILGELVSIGTLLAFAVVCIGVLVLRYSRPDAPRPFRVPAPWFTCIAGAAACFYLMYSLPIDTWLRLAVWTAIGILVYLVYGYGHSRLRTPSR
jgi:APA family basic amino acid/polyamine antiporter